MFAVVESVVARKLIVPEEPLVSAPLTVIESVAATMTPETVNEIVAVSPTLIAEVVADGFTEIAIAVALDGATESNPRPKVATATSATRLNVVFVDICFLSIVDLRNFRRSAWASNALS
jgi:hypothetical protein